MKIFLKTDSFQTLNSFLGGGKASLLKISFSLLFITAAFSCGKEQMLEINQSAPKSTIISERTNDDCSCTLTPFSATDINPLQSWQVGIFDPSNPLQLDKLGGGIGIGAPVGDVTSAIFVPGDDRFIFITLIPDLDTNPIITIVVTCTGVNADGSTRYFPPQYFTFEWENGVPQDPNGLFRNSRAFAIDIPKDCDVREDVPDCHPNCP